VKATTPTEAVSRVSRPNWSALAALTGVNLVWALAYVAVAFALRAIPAPLLALLRVSVAAAALLPWAWRPPLPRTWWTPRRVVSAIGLGFVGFSLPVFLQIEGQAKTSAAMAAFATSLEPLATVLWAALWAGERLGRRTRWALALATVGAWVISGMPRPGHLGQAAGDALLILAVLCYGAYTVLSAQFVRAGPIVPGTAVLLAGGVVTAVPLWWVTGHPGLSAWSWPAMAGLGFIAILGTAVAYPVWMRLIASGPIQLAAVSLYLQPVLGVVAAMVVLGTRPASTFYLGAALIALALFVLRPDRMV
jgi:O-acetylserine/cysteine efflux transporter